MSSLPDYLLLFVLFDYFWSSCLILIQFLNLDENLIFVKLLNSDIAFYLLLILSNLCLFICLIYKITSNSNPAEVCFNNVAIKGEHCAY